MRIFVAILGAVATLFPADVLTAPAYSVPPGISTTLPSPAINYVTPQMFGAVCDGVADDHAALQRAEDAAYASKSAVAFIGPNTCRTTASLRPRPGVDHFCFSGMNLANSATTNACGILNQGGAWAYDMPTTASGVSVMAPTWHDMTINSSGGGIRIGNLSLGKSQAVASYLRIERVNFSATADAVQVTVCFYCKIEQSWFTTPVRFYMSDYVAITNSSFQSQFSGNADPEIILLGDSTYGNDNLVDHNFFECPARSKTSCLKSNVNSVTITNNGFECAPGIGLPSVIDLAAPTSQGGFSGEIHNNNISCDASSARHWLSVENSRFLYRLNATGNWCSCVFGGANFNGNGNGMTPLYVPQTAILSQIYHSGNSNEAGFPFSSFNNAPDAAGSSPGLLMSWAPGGTTYNVSAADYGSSVMVAAGAYRQPAAASGNPLNFTQAPGNFVGMLDICFKARSASSAQTETLVALDGGRPVHSAAITLTGGNNPTWYCHKGANYSAGAAVRLLNSDTRHNADVDIYQVTISQVL
ncbi:MAG TPA: hypothetical protein VN175_11600 [Rhizomicrobium sp.]|nr:hypothetical protein [Rhizomicrobium sp.]